MGFTKFNKDPDATLDYGIDWSDWLDSGDTISSVTWVVPTGITKTAQSHTDTISMIWLSGGTLGQSYDIVCRITTTGGRIDDRTFTIRIKQK